MARDLVQEYSTSNIVSADMGQVVDELKNFAADSRRGHERRWYDNNFFDDGYHFRYLRRTDNKIIDLSSRQTLWAPMRAIPKASRQIRGVANLLVSNDPIPVVYPEHINTTAFANPQELADARKEAKRIAKSSGHWVTEEFKAQNIAEKLAQMIILTAKHSVSWLQVWPDAIDEAIKTQVYDAFDIFTYGTLTEVPDLPFLIKVTPRLISEIKADENFEPKQLTQISPDNRHASSEIKEAYMRVRYGKDRQTDQTATLLQKEAFIKEYLSPANRERIAMQENGGEILQGKKDGDMIIRQVFVGGNIWLRDKYVKLPDIPFVDYRMEPGPIYQVPLIERFIPQNKSYDMLVSRAERFSHTMISGKWAKKQGESYKLSNDAGGDVVEYQTTPPVPIPLPSIPGFYFNLMEMIQQNIEEQGVSVSLNKIPTGVKANAAIESLKESEYSNLVIASRRLKGTVKRIAEKMLDIADDHFVTPKTVYYMEKGEPQYFDVIGKTAMNKRKELNVPVEGEVTPLSRDYHVDIQIQSGMAYTREGQKAAAKELGDYMIQLAQLNLLPPDVVKVFLQTLLETYQFGPTQEVMEAMENNEALGQLTEAQVDQMKIAVMEVMKDLITQGILPDQNQRIEEGKVAVAETIKDTGNFGADQTAESQEKTKVMEDQNNLKIEQGKQKMRLEKLKVMQEMMIKEQAAQHQMKMKEKMTNAQATAIKKGGQNDDE